MSTQKDEIDKFLERYTFPKLTQAETEYLNSPISLKESKLVI